MKGVSVKTSEVLRSRCPQCGLQMTAATSFEGQSPTPGDPTVCIRCGAVLAFTSTMGLRLMTDGEYTKLDAHTRMMIVRIQTGLRLLKAERN